MKTKILKLSVLLFTIFSISCSKDDSQNSSTTSDPTTKKPKKITSVEPGSTPYTFNYEYIGQLLTKMYQTNGITFTFTFTYNTNNRLQSIIGTSGTQTQTTNATYFGNQLTQLFTTANTGGTLNKKFYYNSLNQVNKFELFTNGNLSETHLYIYDGTGNVIKDTSNGIATNYTYDTKNHHFKNVVTQPEDGFLGNPWFGSLNNNYLTKGNYTFTYEYDSDNFPTKRVYKNGSGTIVQTDTFEY